jgi:hypothetical protein
MVQYESADDIGYTPGSDEEMMLVGKGTRG